VTRPKRRDDLQALTGYHSPQLDVSVRLNTNESPFPPPVGFVDAWTEALRTIPYNRYPDRHARDLRSALAATVDCNPDELFCANGSNEVLQTLLLTYGGPGRTALICEPTYALHAQIAQVTGTDVVTVERGSNFTIDVDATVAAIRDIEPAVVFVCSPNNPTGTLEPLETIVAVLAACEEVGALLIVDEAYVEFAVASAVTLIDDDRNLVVTRTYSKVWSMAGMRLGFAVAPPAIVEELEAVVLPYHLSVATQLAGLYALRFTGEMASRVTMIVEERERLSAAMAAMPGIEVFPSGTNFVLIRIAGLGRKVWGGLIDHGVLVRDFSAWPRLTDCLRVTVGTAAENEMFLTALNTVVSALRPAR